MSDDTISRQSAIDAIEEMQIPIMRSIFPEEQFVFKGMSEALSAIKDLPSAQQWIPCSERLPEKAYGQYWVCTETGYQCQCRWTDHVYGLYPSGEWSWKIFDIPQYSHVIAWMPLPEPYKGEQE